MSAARMASPSPWFWEKMHCAAAEHAELALDYDVPKKMRSSLEDWRTGLGNAAAGSFDQRERPTQGYPRLQVEASRPKAPALEPVVVARRPEAPAPVRFRPQASRGLEPGAGKLKPLSTGDLQTSVKNVEDRARQFEPPSMSDFQKQMKNVEERCSMRDFQLKNLEGSIPAKKQSSNAKKLREEASVQEARSLLQKLVQPLSEVSISQPLPVAASNDNFSNDKFASNDNFARAGPEGFVTCLDRQQWDGLETAMNRLQSATQVRQMLTKGANYRKHSKDSLSSASTHTGSGSTAGSSRGHSPPSSSRLPSKELSACTRATVPKHRPLSPRSIWHRP